MASVGARAYNGVWGRAPPPPRGPGAGPLVKGSGGKAPKKLKAFLLVQYFAVFIRFSADNCMTLPEIEITYGNQQEIKVSEGNEKGQGIKIMRVKHLKT